MSDMCIATVVTDGVETDLSGSGLTEEEAIDNIGLNVDLIVDLYRFLGFNSYVLVKQGYRRTIFEFEGTRKNQYLI